MPRRNFLTELTFFTYQHKLQNLSFNLAVMFLSAPKDFKDISKTNTSRTLGTPCVTGDEMFMPKYIIFLIWETPCRSDGRSLKLFLTGHVGTQSIKNDDLFSHFWNIFYFVSQCVTLVVYVTITSRCPYRAFGRHLRVELIIDFTCHSGVTVSHSVNVIMSSLIP